MNKTINQKPQKILISATFTADPIQESLDFWLPNLGLNYEIEFAPYNQIFQQLLDPNSVLSQNHGGLNIILVSLDDWMVNESDSNKFLEEIENLLLALKSAGDHHHIPYIICLTPGSPKLMADPKIYSLFEEMQDFIANQCKKIGSQIHLIKYLEIQKKYPVLNYYNEHGKEIGKILYTSTFFTALGTMLARKIYAINHRPYKVIVLDCDWTLWNGVVGEEGPLGIEIDSPRKALQEFMVAQYEAGMLLCLCSKNNEQDVREVFERRPEMLLKQDHLISWRINWRPKSENIQSLAAELQLGLNSFIFIDDNPMECAEVQANCPEVLTLQLPKESETIPSFLNHIWAFDHLHITKEDRHRTELYRQNINREIFKENSLDLADFIAGLDLKVEISELTGKQITRVSQLTQRTNQFNFTTIRRSEGEIQNLWISQEWECLTVTVHDRFGDYGLVGVMIFQQNKQALKVDTFLLSCRVLGRGVEHQMLAYLGNIGRSRGLNSVDVTYLPTPKNQPALNFLNDCGQPFKRQSKRQEKLEEVWIYKFPVNILAELTYSPNQVNPMPVSIPKTPILKESSSEIPESKVSLEYHLQIAQQLDDPEKILQLIKSQKPKRKRPALSTLYVAAKTELEKLLSSLLQDILSIESIGIDDNFFDLGGDSLQAALFLNTLGDRLGEIIYAVALLEAPTIDRLCEYLKKNYPEAIGKLLGTPVETKSTSRALSLIDSRQIKQLQQVIQPLPDIPKNPPAIFILSPPRSGSTLLRVMLAGHPQLFAPPELHLMSFNNLAERKDSLEKFWSQGIIQAIKELKNISTEASEDYLQTLEDLKLPTQHFYRLLQELAGDRLLVDKTPLYALDLGTLQRIETYFENPLYIHLLRHPYGMIRSFEEIKLDLVLTRFSEAKFTRQELAELLWVISHQNILNFFSSIPQSRHCQITYENLVNTPPENLEKICHFLGLTFCPEMLNPYQNQQERMIQDVYGQSRMLGDLKFNTYKRIESGNAEKWQSAYQNDFLGNITWEFAARLGYDRSIANSGKNSKIHQQSPLVKIQHNGTQLPLFLIHPIGGGVLCYKKLAKHLDSNQPCYALQAPGFNGEQEPLTTIEAMANHYIDAISEVQPQGPYLLGGWSLGGAIAFEMAHQLLQKEQEVALLFLIDSLSPKFYQVQIDEITLLLRFAYHFQAQSQKDLKISYSYLEQFDIDEQLYIIWQQAKNTGAIDREMDLKQFRYIWKVYRANLRALQKYQPKVYSHQMILWRAGQHIQEDYYAGGWNQLVSGGLQVHKMSGDHYSIMEAPQIELLANGITRYIKSKQLNLNP